MQPVAQIVIVMAPDGSVGIQANGQINKMAVRHMFAEAQEKLFAEMAKQAEGPQLLVARGSLPLNGHKG